MKKYESIASDLKMKITTGQFKVSEQMPTEIELMEMYNVSRVTIRNAMDLLEKNNLIERTPRKGTFIKSEGFKSESIKHVVFVMLYNAYESIEIIKGTEECLSESNISLTIKFSDCSVKSEREIILDLLKMDISGLIIYPASSDANLDVFNSIIDRNIPLVFVDKHPKELTCNSVMVNNQQIAKNLVYYLYQRGHRNIAFLDVGLKNQTSDMERFLGYCTAMKTLNLPISKQNVIVADDLSSCMDKFFSLKEKPTAVFCCNDVLALHFIQDAARRGFNVPEDISVVGIDDMLMSSQYKPSLTTVRQPFKKIGRAAAQLMKNLFDNPEGEVRKIYLPGEIIERESTKSRVK